MSPVKDSVVLLVSTESNNPAFGSAFAVARDQGWTYLVTCAHVIAQINSLNCGKFQVATLDQPVLIVKNGSSEGLDMALLKVKGLPDIPLLNRLASADKGDEIQIAGYSTFDKKHINRPMNGKLGSNCELTDHRETYPFWDVHIEDDDFCQLAGGYSGSPLCNDQGHLIGVISHRRDGKKGHAFCISNLITLYPEITTLIPGFSNLKSFLPRSNQFEDLAGSTLPYLLDRKKHRSLLNEAIQDHHSLDKPLICLVYGHKNNCCRDMFFDIVHFFSKGSYHTRFFQETPKDVPIGTGSTGYDLQEAMEIDLKNKFSLNGKGFSFEELAANISELDAPMVIHSILSTSQFKNCSIINLVHDFLKFWKQCRLPGKQRHPVLVCLFISIEPYQLTFTDRILGKKDPNREIRATLESLKFESFGLHGVMLPEAKNISLEEVEEWAQDWQVKQKYGLPIYHHLKSELKSFFYKKNADSQPLDDVAQFIYDLLPASRKSP